jgi:hypothetical protein
MALAADPASTGMESRPIATMERANRPKANGPLSASARVGAKPPPTTPFRGGSAHLFFDALRLRGILAPALRGSDNPMAIACARLLTLRPDGPLRSFPRLRSLMALFTFREASFPYLRAIYEPHRSHGLQTLCFHNTTSDHLFRESAGRQGWPQSRIPHGTAGRSCRGRGPCI